MQATRNIERRPHSFRVTIERADVTYRANVPIGADPAAALKKAIALRDEFFAIHGRYATGQRPRSNTGHVGISETTKWWWGKPTLVMAAVFSRHWKNFAYRTLAERETALAQARAWRQKMEAAPGW